jgi:hypothetical protein
MSAPVASSEKSFSGDEILVRSNVPSMRASCGTDDRELATPQGQAAQVRASQIQHSGKHAGFKPDPGQEGVRAFRNAVAEVGCQREVAFNPSAANLDGYAPCKRVCRWAEECGRVDHQVPEKACSDHVFRFRFWGIGKVPEVARVIVPQRVDQGLFGRVQSAVLVHGLRNFSTGAPPERAWKVG